MSSFSKKKNVFYFFYFPVRSIPTFIFATLWVQRTTERVLLCEHHGLEKEPPASSAPIMLQVEAAQRNQNFSFRLQMGTITHSKALFDLSDRYFNNYVRLILMQSRVRLPDKPLYRTGTLTVRTVKSRVTEAIERTFSSL